MCYLVQQNTSPEEITSSRLLKLINTVPKIQTKYSTEKNSKTLFFNTDKANDKVEKEISKQETKSNSREI
jgi:hypothetical protein